VYRWSAQHPAARLHDLLLQQLQELESEYFMQRSYLLRSIEELLNQIHPKTACAVNHALDHGLDNCLCNALANNLANANFQSLDTATSAAAGTSSAPVAADALVGGQQSLHSKQQLLLERHMLLNILMSLFSEWKPCAPDCFQQLMHAMHAHVFSIWRTEKGTRGVQVKTMQLVSII